MNQLQDANNILMSGGIPWLSFKSIGTSYTGTVTGFEGRQSRDFETGEPSFWDAARTQPKQEVVVTIQTDLNDPSVDGDTGARQFVAPKGSSRAQALRAAIRTAGASSLELGAVLTVTYTHDVPNTKNPRLNGIKQYTCTYAPPAPASTATEEEAQKILASMRG